MCYEDLRQALAATAKERDELKKELALAKERLTLLAGISHRTGDCAKFCVHSNDPFARCDVECERCENPCACYFCEDGSKFEFIPG